jgi:23S rRNA (cytosine1962-C5)-methyltransferase
MFTPDQYELLDFGHGRRLERFGPMTLDRPCPAVQRAAPADPSGWHQADARFDRADDDEGQWTCRPGLPERWTIAHQRLCFELKRTPLGQVGLFPEQAENWDWITQQVRAGSPAPVTVLNLFAYTGGSTLAAAAAGAEVIHVDAARNMVAWARRNAELCALADAPIRWIADDALKFVKRELKRGSRYHAVILDPPSYGHGSRGEVWRLSEHLGSMLQMCGQLTAGQRRFMLLTCHTPLFGPARLRQMMLKALGETDPGTVSAAALTIRSATGREMPSGVVVRWQRQ